MKSLEGMGRETREGGEDGREKDEGAGDLWVLSQVTDRRPAASEAQRSQGSWRRADRLKMVLKSMGEQARRKTGPLSTEGPLWGCICTPALQQPT